MKYAAIADWAEEKQYSVTFMCEQLSVARQGYYRWRSTGRCERERADAELTETIQKISTKNSPGIPVSAESTPSWWCSATEPRPSGSGG